MQDEFKCFRVVFRICKRTVLRLGGTDRMKFADMVVYIGKKVSEQKTRDAVKSLGSRVTTNLP